MTLKFKRTISASQTLPMPSTHHIQAAEDREYVCHPSEDDTSFGNVLVAMGVLTTDQLVTCLRRQCDMSAARVHAGLEDINVKLGVAVRDLGLCADADIETAIAIQAQMRAGHHVDATYAVQQYATQALAASGEALGQLLVGKRFKKRTRSAIGMPAMTLVAAKAG